MSDSALQCLRLYFDVNRDIYINYMANRLKTLRKKFINCGKVLVISLGDADDIRHS